MRNVTLLEKPFDIGRHLENYRYTEEIDLFSGATEGKTRIDFLEVIGGKYPRFVNEYWTAKQRQANSVHEVAYRACFKPQLPRFFIELLTEKGDIVYDPFSGRGTTAIEAALLGRNVIANDINPLSKILAYPRLFIPEMSELKKRLSSISTSRRRADLDLSMFYHLQTER